MRFLGVLLLSLLLTSTAALSVFSDDEFSYGPACQWIRLIGEVKRPAELAPGRAVQLTVTYRFEEQEAPATLLTNYPLQEEEFAFVLSGFDKKLAGVLFVPPMFFFNKRIEFDYFAKTGDGAWVSDYRKSIYHPERIKKDGKVFCQTKILLEPLELRRRQ